MELSVLVAKIAALVYLSAGVGALFATVNYNKVIEEFQKSTSLSYLAGFMALVIGMLLVNYHNVWEWNWTVLITIIGWAGVLKGMVLIAFPGAIAPFRHVFKNIRALGVVLIALGLLFGYFGFLA